MLINLTRKYLIDLVIHSSSNQVQIKSNEKNIFEIQQKYTFITVRVRMGRMGRMCSTQISFRWFLLRM